MSSPTPVSTSLLAADTPVLLVLLPQVGTAQPVRTATLAALQALQQRLGSAIRVLTVEEGSHPIVVRSFPPVDLPAFVLVRQGVELWRQQGLPEGESIVAHLLSKLAPPACQAPPMTNSIATGHVRRTKLPDNQFIGVNCCFLKHCFGWASHSAFWVGSTSNCCCTVGLYHLMYQSQARRPFDTAALTTLLHQARTFNRAHHLTGLLLHTPDGRFFQILEGEETVVRTLYYDHIVADPRHHRCRLLGAGACAERSFADWHTGFRVANASELHALLAAATPAELVLFAPSPARAPSC